VVPGCRPEGCPCNWHACREREFRDLEGDGRRLGLVGLIDPDLDPGRRGRPVKETRVRRQVPGGRPAISRNYITIKMAFEQLYLSTGVFVLEVSMERGLSHKQWRTIDDPNDTGRT
jgi:hypothetical protein